LWWRKSPELLRVYYQNTEESFTMNSTFHLLPLALLFYCSAQCSPRTEHSWTREIIDPDGIRVVENGPRPEEWLRELPVLRVQEEVVIGRDEGPEEYLLSFKPYGR